MRDDPEFETFVRTSSALLLRTAFLLTGDRGNAEDLLQTALMRTYRHWRKARSAPVPYVRQVLTNLWRDSLRRARVRPQELPLQLPGADALQPVRGPAEQLGQRSELVAALAGLPAGQRAVIVMRFVNDLSVAETAALLGLSDGTVKSYTSRAIASLRAVLTDADLGQHATEVHSAH